MAEFARLPEGRGILNDEFIHRPTGTRRTVGEAGLYCTDAILRSIKASEEKGSGLYVVPNTNPKQTSPSGVMRDGFDAFYYPEGDTGKKVDFDFLAHIDNQALVHEALQAAAELYPDDDAVNEWLGKAEEIRQRTIEAFWMPDQNTFAAAVDQNGRQVQLESTAAVEVLNGPFLKDYPNGIDIVRGLVRWLYSDGVMTPIGPRMMHKKFGKFEGDYYAYQGSGAVWPHVNGIITKGLRQHGLYTPARDLGLDRTLGWLNRSGEAIEMGYVDRDTNEPCYNPYPQVKRMGAKALAAAELGQLDQAWAASAGLAEIWAAPFYREERLGSWQRSFGREIMDIARHIPKASNSEPAADLYIDQEKGSRLKKERAQRTGLVA